MNFLKNFGRRSASTSKAETESMSKNKMFQMPSNKEFATAALNAPANKPQQ